MVLVELAIIAGAALAGAAGVVHLWDRFHPRGLYRRVEDRTAAAPTQITSALQNVLQRGLESPAMTAQLERLNANLEAMGKMVEIPAEPDLRKVASAMGGTMKGENALAREAESAIGQSLLGPYGPLLQQFAPPLFEFLSENPHMALQIMEWPVVKKIIQKASAVAGGVTGGQESGAWGP